MKYECGECLCRVCINNEQVIGIHAPCQGCSACTGIVDIESDCVNPVGFELADDEVMNI